MSISFEPLIHRWPELRAVLADLHKSAGNGDEDIDALSHVKLLDDLLSAEFSEVEEAMVDMKNNGVITFANVWTIFHPNSLIFTRQDNQDRALRLLSSQYGVDRNQQPVYGLTAAYVDFDGQRFGIQKISLSLANFEGTKRISSLAAFPIEFHAGADQIKAKLIERGAKIEALAGSFFQNYNGVGWRIGVQGTKEKHTVKGRVVIDPFGYNRFEPDFAVYVTPLNAAIPTVPSGVSPHSSRLARLARIAGYPASDFIERGHLIDNSCDDDGGMPADGFFDDEENAPKRPALTDEQKLICTPLVRGYALKEKKWLNLFVNAISVSPPP